MSRQEFKRRTSVILRWTSAQRRTNKICYRGMARARHATPKRTNKQPFARHLHLHLVRRAELIILSLPSLCVIRCIFICSTLRAPSRLKRQTTTPSTLSTTSTTIRTKTQRGTFVRFCILLARVLFCFAFFETKRRRGSKLAAATLTRAY